MTVLYLDTPVGLLDFCQQIQNSSWLAVDTEFLREKTYYPQLCLIQIANDDVIACIDPLAIDDLTPLFDVLYQPKMTLVFHAARQDLELLLMHRQQLPDTIFDTQLAASVLGLGEQVGYGNLVKTVLNVDLDKAHSRTDWTARPLSTAQLDYAADDVRYLRSLYHQMQQSLTELNRTHWLADDFAALSDPQTYQADPETIWRKIRGAGKLKPRQLANLQQLAAWRERNAIQRNRPRRWILKDDVMLDLARFAPDSLTKLSQIRGLEPRDIDRHGQAILDVLEKASQIPKADWPVMLKPEPLTNQQEALLDALMALLRQFCDEQAISPAAVATRKDIEKLVRGETTIPLLKGWRKQIVGRKLQAFLQGKLVIHADAKQLIINEVE
ncbi:Ribonuclease D [Methylophaga frappieri]|uniref:Ribonuclease D n=1 Tax=Methylophaga frappieri (strain ATCC BAA-2434 / DSM 25690 / JAM7) TaxID=754477 RepID=I1YGM3_METFJ|nr:ribonuclease D [Methylophaga frappieri]AFJ02066.1 Ribonuclease D [Methylophaga frappieri]